MKQVAFIGLGNMGGPMAKNLLAAGWSVSAFDLSQAALDDVTSAGAHGAKSAAEACESCDVVISMLPAGKHVKSVMMGFDGLFACLLYTSPSPRDLSTSRMPSSA